MPRLTRKEIDELKRRLARWQTPGEMSRLVDETRRRIESAVFFTQAGLDFLRDGWIAVEFGRARNAEQVRLVENEWPDFELRVGGTVEPFEAVEGDNPDRRRGDEYRNQTGEPEPDPFEDWVARAEAAPDWLDTVCRKKADKHYAAGANLVIYLNLIEYGARQTEVVNSFPTATQAAKDKFDAVWVLWKSQAYLVWKKGKTCSGEGTTSTGGALRTQNWNN